MSMSTDRHEAFNRAIEEMLPELEQFDKLEDHTEHDPMTGIVPGDDIVSRLVEGYDRELAHLYETYRSIVKVNPALLKELGVSKDCILKALRSKITGLKDKYWQSLFDCMKDITKRLATKQRRSFLSSLKDKGTIDFTHANIQATLVWVAKWASTFYEEQLIDLFKSMSQHANIETYKSNQKVLDKGNWRYLRDEASHYKLDYRLVIVGFGGINTSSYSWESSQGLENRSHEFLSDIITVANNLGFDCDDSSHNYGWRSNKKNLLLLNDSEPLAAVRAFKNGNLHIHMAKQVILALNIQAGKLLGWIRNPSEAARELDVADSDMDFVRKVYGMTCRIEPRNLRLTVNN